MASLQLVGLSHRSAEADVFAAMSLRPHQVRQLAEAARLREGFELVTVATCNRTEFYVAGDEPVAQLLEVLGAVCPERPSLSGSDGWYQHTGPAVVRHLMRVACGLESQLLGDGQILGQLRQAVTVAQQARTLGTTLSPVFSQAIRTGRVARQTTDIGRGSPGVASAITSLVLRSAPASPSVLVLGAGETGQLTVGALRQAGVDRLVVANRTTAAAHALAHDHGASWVPWSEVPQAVACADVVVVATAADAPVLTCIPPRTDPLLVIDAGSPAQVSTTVRSTSTELVALGALRAAHDKAATAREAAVPDVEVLIEQAVTAWSWGQDNAELEAAIKELHRIGHEAAGQLAVALAEHHDVPLEELEGRIQRTVKAVIHDRVSQLRAARPRVPSPRP